MKKAIFACPASLSFIFKAVYQSDPLKSGSIGIGATLDKKVEIVAEKSNVTRIFFNEKKISFPTVSTVLKSLTNQPLRIKITSSLPLGYGFGISAASSLATAFAVNKLLGLNKKREELIKLCHKAEIVNRTGLGSVVTASIGGFLLKTKAGIPTNAFPLPYIGQKLYAVIIDKLTTPSVLSSNKRLEIINKAAKRALTGIRKSPSLRLSEIIDIAYNFVTEANLLTDKRVNRVIEEIRKSGGHATMAVLGQVVISDVKPRLNNYRVEELTII